MDTIKTSLPLPLDGTYNVRDLGGYLTKSGETTRHKEFLRADSLEHLTEAAGEALYDYGIRLVIDVRSDAEVQTGKDHLSDNIEYAHLPLLDNIQSRFLSGKMPDDMGDVYIGLIENSKQVLAEIFHKMTSCTGGLLYHCTAGKDRTGTITMLLLELAGVPVETVIADYAVSEGYMQPVFDRQRAMLKNAGISVPEFVFQSKPAFMEKLIAYVRAHYGTAQEYLMQVGLTAQEINKLKEKILGRTP